MLTKYLVFCRSEAIQACRVGTGTGVNGRNVKKALGANWRVKEKGRKHLGKCLDFWTGRLGE